MYFRFNLYLLLCLTTNVAIILGSCSFSYDVGSTTDGINSPEIHLNLHSVVLSSYCEVLLKFNEKKPANFIAEPIGNCTLSDLGVYYQYANPRTIIFFVY